MRYDIGVIIGRFQPFHLGHKELFEEALCQAKKLLIVLGSSESARSIRNPWTVSEREDMIISNFVKQPEILQRIHFAAVRDYFYNDQAWVNEVREKVRQASPEDAKIVLFGHEKDGTSFYLKWFPEWDYINKEQISDFHSTQIRHPFLRDAKNIDFLPGVTPETQQWLNYFSNSKYYGDLHQEQIYVDDYQRQWAQAPYPPILVTTDALVFQLGHILLIRRGQSPGKGLWGLPGGFLNTDERLKECSLRELFEETQIDASVEELKESFIRSETFDHPLRSVRGRTITHVHMFKLKGDRLRSVKANDDAAEVRWLPLLDVAKMEDQFFEDHFHIISRMISSL